MPPSRIPPIPFRLPYTQYVAKIAQAGTSAPTATILTNTLGGLPVWARTSAGLYTLTLAGAFTTNSTIVLNCAGKSTTPATQGIIVQCAITSANVITFYGFDAAGAAADWTTSDMGLEIRVYKGT